MRYFSNQEVKTIRYILGMTQTEFAQLIGCTQQLISYIEHEKVPVSHKVNESIHKVVVPYIDKETLFKILDGEIEI